MTITLSSPARLFSPSISCINSVMTPRCAMTPPELCADVRAPKSASISSRKTTHGERRRARLKTARTSFSPSPTYCIWRNTVRKWVWVKRMTYHVHDVRRGHHQHPTACLFSECTHDEGFPRPWRPKEKTPCHGMLPKDTHLERSRVEKGQRDQCSHRVNCMLRKVNLCKCRRKGS